MAAHTVGVLARIGTIFAALVRSTGGASSSRSGTATGAGIYVCSIAYLLAENFTGTIGRAKLDGTDVDQNFITGASNLVSIALHRDHIYWGNAGAGGLGNAPIGGQDSTAPTLSRIPMTGGAAGVAVHGDHIYWSNDGGPGALGGGQSIGRARLDGTEVDQSFITGASLPNGVAVNRRHLLGQCGWRDRRPSAARWH